MSDKEDKFFVFTKDDNGHWYIVPKRTQNTFHRIMKEAYSTDDFEVFESMFAKCRIPSPYAIQFENPRPLNDR